MLGRLTCFCNPAIVCQSCLTIALLRSDDICIYFTCVSYILYELYLFNYLPISSFSCVWVLNSWPHPSSMRIMILVSVRTSSGKNLVSKILVNMSVLVKISFNHISTPTFWILLIKKLRYDQNKFDETKLCLDSVPGPRAAIPSLTNADMFLILWIMSSEVVQIYHYH